MEHLVELPIAFCPGLILDLYRKPENVCRTAPASLIFEDQHYEAILSIEDRHLWSTFIARTTNATEPKISTESQNLIVLGQREKLTGIGVDADAGRMFVFLDVIDTPTQSTYQLLKEVRRT